MAHYVISQKASRNLAEIYDHHLSHGASEDSSNLLMASFLEVFQMLADFPYAGRPREYLPEGILAFPHKNHLIIYRLKQASLEILHIVHGKIDLYTFFNT